MQPLHMLRSQALRVARAASWSGKPFAFVGIALLCAITPALRAQSSPQTTAAGASEAGTTEAGASAAGQQSFHLFALHSVTDNNQANDLQTALRNMVPRAKIYYVIYANALAVTADPQQMQLIETIITDLDKPRAIYRLTYTLTESGTSGVTRTEHETVMLAAHGETTLRQGVRVPLVTGTSAKGDQGTQIQYIDLGLRIEASLEGVGQGLRLHSKIERSSIADLKSTVPPDPEIRQVTLDERSPIVEGKSVSIGTLDLSDGKVEISVRAEAVP